MPLLLPGIPELSRRARYFSFHAFLLAEYRDRLPVTAGAWHGDLDPITANPCSEGEGNAPDHPWHVQGRARKR